MGGEFLMLSGIAARAPDGRRLLAPQTLARAAESRKPWAMGCAFPPAWTRSRPLPAPVSAHWSCGSSAEVSILLRIASGGTHRQGPGLVHIKERRHRFPQNPDSSLRRARQILDGLARSPQAKHRRKHERSTQAPRSPIAWRCFERFYFVFVRRNFAVATFLRCIRFRRTGWLILLAVVRCIGAGRSCARACAGRVVVCR